MSDQDDPHRLPRPRRGRGRDVREASRAAASRTSSCGSTSRRASSRRSCAAGRFTEAPDITARICGICPVAYQMSAVRAMEDACGVSIDAGRFATLRRLLYCGEWIESHACTSIMLHAPDFLGYPGAIEMARDHPDSCEQGLELKKAGNELIDGGRRPRGAPDQRPRRRLLPRSRRERELARVVPSLQRAREIALAAVALGRRAATSPTCERDYELRRAVATRTNTRSTGGRIVSNSGPRHRRRSEYDEHFVEEHVEHSNALHSRAPRARRLSQRPARALRAATAPAAPLAREAAAEAGLGADCRNPFASIVVRAVELVHACDEALRDHRGLRASPTRPAVEVVPRRRRRPRRHRGPARDALPPLRDRRAKARSSSAEIVPPTSQNQRTIEEDLRDGRRALRSTSADDGCGLRCEQAIRNYDPCISCATHFLTLAVDRA